MLDGKNYIEEYGSFEKLVAGKEPDWLTEMRSNAIADFKGLGFPSTKEENWRYTNLKPFAESTFALANGSKDAAKIQAAIERSMFNDLGGHIVVFVNGRFDARLSKIGTLPDGVILTSLSAAIEKHPDLVQQHLGKLSNTSEYPFQSLNAAFMGDGLFLHVACDINFEQPVQVIHVYSTGGVESVSYPRNLLVMEENASATVVETHIGASDEKYFTNTVTETVCSTGSHLRHYKVLRDSKLAHHFLSSSLTMDKASELKSMTVVLGGRMVRNDQFAELQEDDINCTLDGLYFIRGEQQVDNFTRVRHIGLDGNSRQVFKGILDDNSRGVFDGRIFVNEGAQKTDAVQTNRNLLLSDDAVAYAKPQLEIYADDVKCTHAATTGQIDVDQLFYLQTRGFDKKTAQAILTYAFAGELIDTIEVDEVRVQLEQELQDLLTV